MSIQKNDFVELEFKGKVKGGNLFDTNIKEEAKNMGIDAQFRPLVIIIGQNMILPAIDEFLEGKDIGKYTLELTPEKSFGYRDKRYIRTMPIKIFYEKEIMPKPGMVFQFDNLMGKISAVSGGRVIVDFNNPIAGKDVIYELDVKKILTDINEKAKSFLKFLFQRDLDFQIQEKKLIITAEPNFAPLINFYQEKIKEVLSLDLEVKEKTEEKKEEKKEETVEEKKEEKIEEIVEEKTEA
jgi:FKBP-type peptidyl-prolyl cis-trans isomerase 2